MKGLIKEFKDFITQGNVMDMAVGIIMGAAFKQLIEVFVSALIMPIVSLPLYFLNDFGVLKIDSISDITFFGIQFGYLIDEVVSFLLLALGVFLLVKIVNKFRKPAEVTTKECQYCKSVINIKAVKCPCCGSDIAE